MVTLVGIALVLGGLFYFFFPGAVYWLDGGWKLKGAEPSDLYRMILRATGILVLLGGGFVLQNATSISAALFGPSDSTSVGSAPIHPRLPPLKPVP